MGITNALFAGVITLSMLKPSWDPVIGTLGGVLDPKIIISCLNTEWIWRQGLTSNAKDGNVVFQTGNKSQMKCEICNQSGHMKTRCWEKGGGQEGQYPEWFQGKKAQCTSNTIRAVTETPIVWTYDSAGQPDVWFSDSATTVHEYMSALIKKTSSLTKLTPKIETSKHSVIIRLKALVKETSWPTLSFKERSRKFVSCM